METGIGMHGGMVGIPKLVSLPGVMLELRMIQDYLEEAFLISSAARETSHRQDTCQVILGARFDVWHAR
jgi:hypothetical protein